METPVGYDALRSRFMRVEDGPFLSVKDDGVLFGVYQKHDTGETLVAVAQFDGTRGYLSVKKLETSLPDGVQHCQDLEGRPIHTFANTYFARKADQQELERRIYS
ncbi:hypothetical protein HYV86_00330 [Candidatus Woesearchaeota archaeon]|nr:hypothetical protein [Candidatus Woesearchaeota archaeon]